MSKEKPSTEIEALRKQEKKAKKEKKEKRSETDGVKKSKKDKKDSTSKKERKEKKKDGDEPAIGDEVSITTTTAPKSKPVTVEEEAGNGDVEMTTTTPLLNALEEQTSGPGLVKDEKVDSDIKPKEKPLLGALVPFAVPLADEKVGKKVLKGVKKAARNKTLKRGVKEVVKALRKSPTTPTSSLPTSVVVIAADISPMDVISHLPVLCEDHGVPYIFVPSRAELGAAGSTKRPTSVVMIGKEKGRKKEGEEGKKEDEEDWGEVYAELVKVVQKAGRNVRV
ncbi:MAG: hypothetical protein Q9178_003274 [Gyalolechia marmorata]